MTPRCLPMSGTTPSKYDMSAMVYSFGTILWSMFHGARQPFCGEEETNIKNRLYRSNHSLEIDDQLVPNKMKQVTTKIYDFLTALRPTLFRIYVTEK